VSIEWIDLSADEVRRARDLLGQVQTEGVLDELGFGILQTAIADRLYPATTTVMTRSRYLFFLPAIYGFIEGELAKKSMRVSDLGREARRLQDELRQVLSRNETQGGVIGEQKGLDIQRLPSDIYWSSLKSLEIFRGRLSQAGYFDHLRTISGRGRAHQDDDGNPHPLEGDCWDRGLPLPRLDGVGRFAGSTTFRLTRDEAHELTQRFAQFTSDEVGAKERTPCLLSHLVREGIGDVPFPWSAPNLPAGLARLLRHARALSMLARGATLQYHEMLVEARERARLPVPGVDVAGTFREWWSEARSVLRTWDLTEFVRLPQLAGALRGGDQRFLDAWRIRCVASPSPETLLRDEAAQELIRRREKEKRPYKARLRSPRHLERWKAPRTYGQQEDRFYELWYRHGIGRQFVEDILTGLR
jgi:hypothetical protein